MRDPYEVLGVAKSASAKDIKSAYRKLAKKFHPDQNPNDSTAKDRFAAVNQAYEIVGDEKQRAAFDRGEIGADGKPRFQGFEGAAGGDPFSGFRRQQGPGGELGDPATAGRLLVFAEPERALVPALHEMLAGIGQRAENAGHVVAAEVGNVPVDEDDDLPGHRGERPPHRVTLAPAGPETLDQFVFRNHLGSGFPGDRGGAVGGVGIDHEDLPDQPVLGQHLKLGHGCRDRPRRVPGRDHHADRFPQLAADVGGGEVPVVEGV